MSEKRQSGFKEIVKETSLYPQEALLKIKNQKNRLFIGLPKEVALQENRISLTPEAVALFVNNGHEIRIEAGAGSHSKFSDREYSDAGAKIIYSHKEIFEADIVLKVEPPTMEEINYLKPGNTLISALQLGNQKPDYIHALNQKKVTSIAFELIEDKVGGMPVVGAERKKQALPSQSHNPVPGSGVTGAQYPGEADSRVQATISIARSSIVDPAIACNCS